jgi:hypothetical protein
MYTSLFNKNVKVPLREASFGTQVKDKIFKIFASLLSKRVGKPVLTSAMIMDLFKRDGHFFGGVMYSIGHSGERMRVNVDMDDASTRPYCIDYWPDNTRTDDHPYVSIQVPVNMNLIQMLDYMTNLIKKKGKVGLDEAANAKTIKSVESWMDARGYDVNYILQTDILDLMNDYNSSGIMNLGLDDFAVSTNKILTKNGVAYAKVKKFRHLLRDPNLMAAASAGQSGPAPQPMSQNVNQPTAIKPGPAKKVLSARELEIQKNLELYQIKETDLKGRIRLLSTLTRDVASGSLYGLLVTGTPGIGKTFTVEKILKEEFGMTDGVDYLMLSGGKMTATGLFIALHDNRDKLIIIDDNDTVWFDDASVNMLKGALQTQGSRTVTNNSAQIIKNYETPFIFGGQLIFITNLVGADLSAADPVLDRIPKVHFNISQESLLLYVEEMLDKIYNHIDINLKIEIFKWFELMGPSFPSTKDKGLSIRTYTKTLDIVLRGHPEEVWKELALTTL